MSLVPWSAIDSKTVVDDTDFFMLLVPTGVLPADKNRTISGADAKLAFTPALAAKPTFTWGVTDEDSPLTTGILYITEAGEVTRTLEDVILSLKNAPTGTPITVDILKETGVNTNVFVTIFSTLPIIDINEFTSQTATPAVISDTTWEAQRRLQIKLTVNDSNFAATGLKGTLVIAA